MRVSVRKDDAGYRPDAHDFEAFLDGQRVEHCFTADEELGEAHVFDLSPKTRLSNYSRPAEKVLTGKVEIRRRKSQ